MASIVATWGFGLLAVKVGRRLLSSGSAAVDVCEHSIAHVENDYDLGIYFVGRGGCPNSEGMLQCDAALMDGQGHKFGAVAGLERIGCPIHVARAVMDKSRHNFLVGKGAQDFAVKQGFQLESNDILIAEHQYFKNEHASLEAYHDTLGVIARDKSGNIAAGVSTSGLAYKAAGRVGDSPLPGGGLYVDNDIGAACATGDGDNILRFCPSHEVVRLMGGGLGPQEACLNVVKDIARKVGNMFEIGIIAMDKQGNVGASGSVTEWRDPRTKDYFPGFPFAVWSEHQHTEETILFQPSAS